MANNSDVLVNSLAEVSLATREIALHPDHLADLKKSGLTDEMIVLMGVFTVRPADITKALGWDPSGVTSVLAFPYPSADGFIRYKVFPAVKNKDGRSIRYLQKKGTGPHLYILPSVKQIFTDSSVSIALAEGEKKAAALVQSGVQSIGVGGIWNWVDGSTHKPLSEIEQIAWVDREVTLYFDSDIWHRPDLLKPVYALGMELEERGALVRVIQITQKNDEKVGIDDFLVTSGPEAIRTLKSVPLSHKAFSHAHKWWKGWRGKRDAGAYQKRSDLRGLIQSIRKTSSQDLRAFEKKQLISAETLSYLLGHGVLYITPEERGYYFTGGSGLLYSLHDDAFQRLLSDATGLNPVETEFKYLAEQIITETKIRGTKTEVHQLAHYNQGNHRLYISDFKGGMFALDGQKVSHAPNGQDGVLFVTSSFTNPFKYLKPEERIENATVGSFLSAINCDDHSLISPQDMRSLLFVWLLSIFFPELHPTKIIPTFIGPQGSTKTTTARRFGIQLVGDRFNVGHLEAAERGEHAFIASVCGKPFVAFDNADAPIKWLPDRLATFATGHEFELRELYTTNQLAVFKPMASIVLTSRDPHFRRPDVAERLLIAKLMRPKEFIPESEVVRDLMKRRDSVWSDLLDTLNWALNALRDNLEAPRMDFRMADYASFGWRISMAQGGDRAASAFCEALKNLEKEQASYTTEEDPVTMCLGTWLQKENGFGREKKSNFGREIDTGLLYKELSEIAREEGLMLPKTSASFGKRLRQAKKAIEMTLGIKIVWIQTTHTSRWCFLEGGQEL